MDWGKINHFDRDDFKCPCCGKNNIQEHLVWSLDCAREIAGIPFIVSSGCRCEKHNREVGGKPDSAHIKGWAVDIKATNSRTRFKIVAALIMSGFNRIGIAKNFIHADKDPDKPKNVMWVY